jgi:hypothetical protein
MCWKPKSKATTRNSFCKECFPPGLAASLSIGHKNDIGCLRLGRARILHLPGELFVEYQLRAKQQRKDLFIAMRRMAIMRRGTSGRQWHMKKADTRPNRAHSNVAPEVENVLNKAIEKLLRN